MIKKNKPYLYVILSLCLIIGLLSCNRLKQGQDLPLNNLTVVSDKTTLTNNESITLNASGISFNADDLIEWSATDGMLNPATGNQVIFTAPDKEETVTIHITVTAKEAITSCDFALQVKFVEIRQPSAPQKVSAIPSDNCLMLSWEASKTEKVDGYRIYYSKDANKAAQYVRDAGFVSTYTLTGLENNQEYYVAIAAYYLNPVKVESQLSERICKTPIDAQKPGKPLSFNVIVNYNESSVSADITLTWKNPSDADFQGVTVRRKKGSFPSKDEGTEVCNGNVSTIIDKDLEIGVQYFYSIYAYDEIPLFSEPATRSVTIGPPN